MSQTRNEITDDDEIVSLLDLPQNVFEENIAITAEVTVLDNLSATCQTLHAFFQPELD